MRAACSLLVAWLVLAAGVASAQEWVPLFNGKDLSGWQGDLKGYVVQDGVIVATPKSHNLFTKKQYGDFELYLEFRLTPGANNGIAFRAPLKGHPTFDGNEIQILDDYAPRYKNLKPYQFCGSLYGVVPARRGHLKPAGQWNQMLISVRGRHVRVKLNGAVVVDANVDQAAPGGKTVDHRPHPGLKRSRGYIGFLGHGTRVDFRNIRIRSYD